MSLNLRCTLILRQNWEKGIAVIPGEMLSNERHCAFKQHTWEIGIDHRNRPKGLKSPTLTLTLGYKSWSMYWLTAFYLKQILSSIWVCKTYIGRITLLYYKQRPAPSRCLNKSFSDSKFYKAMMLSLPLFKQESNVFPWGHQIIFNKCPYEPREY